jgi:hypothetical protein
MSQKDVDSIPVQVSKVQLKPGGRARALAVFRCRPCNIELDILQPDTRNPDRLLGTCPGCGGWSLIECRPDEGLASIAPLPSLGVAIADRASAIGADPVRKRKMERAIAGYNHSSRF